MPPKIDAVVKAVEEYNKYRCPEACAEILWVDGNKAYIYIEGTYCATCGLYDWLEDLAYILEEKGVPAKLQGVIEPRNPETPWRIAIYEFEDTA